MLAYQRDVDTPDVHLATPLTSRSDSNIYSDLPLSHSRCEQTGSVTSEPKSLVWRCYRHDSRRQGRYPEPPSLRNLGLISVQHSETTTAALVFLFYRLVRHSEHLLKVQEELDTAGDVEDFDTLHKLPHLNGVINETLRLHPGVPTGGLRETPPGGAVICGRFVPGNTVICAPRYTIGRREYMRKGYICQFKVSLTHS